MISAFVVRASDGVAIAGGVLLAVVVLLIIGYVWRGRRALVRRVSNLSLRLEEQPPTSESRFLEKNLTRLDRAVDSSVLARGEATVAAGRLAQALETIPQGVAISRSSEAHARRAFR